MTPGIAASWPLDGNGALHRNKFFSFHHVQYNDAIWWKFALHGEASRFLRAARNVAIVTLRRIVPSVPRTPARAAVLKRRRLMTFPPAFWTKSLTETRTQTHSSPSRAIKKFKVHTQGNVFLMYGIQGRFMGGIFSGTSAETATPRRSSSRHTSGTASPSITRWWIL